MHKILSIAGVTIGVEHQYELSAWVCSGHETDALPQFTVSVTDGELQEEYDRLGGQFGMEACECNCLYRKASLGMLDYDGFLLHATAVAVDGEGYVFTAPGGTGKSTHAGYWMQAFGERAIMVNGDKPIIRLMDSRFHVCGTPWRGKERLGSTDIVPLKGVCLLERGTMNEIAPADADTVIDKIFHQVLLPEEPGQVMKQLDLLDQLVQEVPIYCLKCNMSTEAAVIAYNGMKVRR